MAASLASLSRNSIIRRLHAITMHTDEWSLWKDGKDGITGSSGILHYCWVLSWDKDSNHLVAC
jgi:hypothetical protein